MKSLLLILTAAILFVGCGSKSDSTNEEDAAPKTEESAVTLCKCEIVGRLDNYNAKGEVYLTDCWSAQNIIASTNLVDNTFVLKDVEHAPTFAHLMLRSGRPVADLFIEDGKVLVSGDYNKGTIMPSGTPANDAFSEMMVRNYDLLERRRNAIGARDEAAVEAIQTEIDLMLLDYLEKNRGNVFGLYMLQQLSQALPAKQMLEELALLPEELQTVAVAERMKRLTERRFKTEPQVAGSDYVPHYIDIVQPNLDGEEVSLKSVVENKKNRYVLLNFWASWWAPSKEDAPMLKQAYSLYHDKGFEIYGASLDRRKDFWKEAVDELGIEWITVSSLEEFNTKAVEDYAVEPKLLPNLLIDCSNGVIVAKNLRGRALVEKLAELLK